MDISYADFIISKYSNFLDPFSLTEISIERLCYPVAYANEEMLRGWQGINQLNDVEDDLLIRQSLLKDMPESDKIAVGQTFITDGAAHILRNRTRESFVQLLGMPKIGKSTLLKKVALLAAQEMKHDPSSPAPLLICLENVVKGEVSSKMELIEACFSQCEEFEAYLREKFFQGKLLLLLDEVDKVGDFNRKLVEWLKALKTFVKLPLCVISSRYSGYLEIENVPVVYIDIYPLKLQISMAQNMLSELQFERFVEGITGRCAHFCEIASTPYLFSLLLEMFRWGEVGTEEPESRGKLYFLAVKHLLGTYQTQQHWQGFEAIATDLLIRDSKSFNFIDIKNIGLDHIWPDVKISKLLLSQVEVIKGENSDDDFFKENAEDEDFGSGQELLDIKQLVGRDTTPQWVSYSKESYMNYQIARKCIVRGAFGDNCNDSYRFLHLRLLEVLAARNYLNQLEDSLLHPTGGFLMESSAFQKAFSTCFPLNFLFCRRFREVLLFLAALCSENIFENLVKYLLSKESIEYCYITEKLFKERGILPAHRPLINKLRGDRLEFSRKNFVKGFGHPSITVQRLCKQEALENGLQEADLTAIINKNIDYLLKSSHWICIKQLTHLGRESNSKVIKSIFTKLQEVSIEILSHVTRPSPYKVIVHKVFLLIFLSTFEKSEPQSHQTSSNFTPPVSSSNTPNKYENQNNTEESTIRISFDKVKFPKNEAVILEKIVSSSKLISVLIDLIQICPAIDINLCVKVLMVLGCSISQIHISLAARFSSLEDKVERVEILKVLRLLGFVTQHTVDVPLVSLNLDPELQTLAKDILKMLNSDKLKKHALNVLMKEDSPQLKILLALRALGFCANREVDKEAVYFLVQFVDHYILELRLEAIKSLYMLLKSGKPIDDAEIRKDLAVVPHLLKDRIRLLRYDPVFRSYSLKCLISLWICLDKGKEDSNATEMFHILVKEQIKTSFLVGSMSQMLGILKDFLVKTNEEKEAAWICLRKMSPILEYLEISDHDFIINEMKAGLFNDNPYERKCILKMLLINPISNQDKSAILSIILNSNFESHKSLIRYIAALLSKWNEIITLKQLIPTGHQITPELHRTLSKLRMLIESLYNCLENSNSDNLNELKHLHNFYKSLVNQVVENIQWPSKILPQKNQLLDISADPSFFRDEAIPEISNSYTDLDASINKSSVERINTEIEEQPPPIELCQQLILSGVRSEGFQLWLLWYLKNAETFNELYIAAECWNLINHSKDFYNPSVESILMRYLATNPDEIIKVIVEIRFKSDSFCAKLVEIMIRGEFRAEHAHKAIQMTMELNSPLPLEEIYKMMCFSCNDTVLMHFLHACSAKIMENITISSDTQMNSVIRALVSTGCSLLVQPIWNYWIKTLGKKPSYLLTLHTTNILENCSSWDCRFLLSRARILGLLPIDAYHKETGSSMSTKKL